MLIARVNGLKFKLYIVHEIRHSIKYLASKDQKAFIANFNTVYKAETLELPERYRLELDDNLGKKHPMLLR